MNKRYMYLIVSIALVLILTTVIFQVSAAKPTETNRKPCILVTCENGNVMFCGSEKALEKKINSICSEG